MNRSKYVACSWNLTFAMKHTFGQKQDGSMCKDRLYMYIDIVRDADDKLDVEIFY